MSSLVTILICVIVLLHAFYVFRTHVLRVHTAHVSVSSTSCPIAHDIRLRHSSSKAFCEPGVGLWACCACRYIRYRAHTHLPTRRSSLTSSDVVVTRPGCARCAPVWYATWGSTRTRTHSLCGYIYPTRFTYRCAPHARDALRDRYARTRAVHLVFVDVLRFPGLHFA